MRSSFNIWDEMRRMQESMDSLFNNFFSDSFVKNPLLIGDINQENLLPAKYKMPISDLYETEKEFVAELDMPGLDKSDIKVNVTKNSIEIKAEKCKEEEQENKKKGFYKLERNFSGFYKNFALPNNIDSEKAKAEYKNGVLRVSIPKLEIEEEKKKYLDIN
ncbi:MAG: Hsp20/alpha crystallin family protein [Candidatus Nanoarchaeia archaeon]|jgi:HSP20 family protein|nr:Hsp20/alpha crystallin family protein [Candidatus Nanoarchaeia archaeon]MDD4563761.1 Hsp20/alpha crystallin family protein [Candidatus Nanoarchaeia archaeon]